MDKFLLWLGSNEKMHDEAIHFLLAYAWIVTMTLFQHQDFAIISLVIFAPLKEFIIDIFGPEHDTFEGSLMDFSFYALGGCVALLLIVYLTR